MRRRSTLPFVLLVGGLTGCGAGASRAQVSAAEQQARAAQADAMRERAQLIEIEARLIEMERRLARQPRDCEAPSDSESTDVPGARGQPSTEPLRSNGDFLAEARVVPPSARAPAAKTAGGAPSEPANPASERQRLEQLLDGLRDYALDPRSGLSHERREALRVLLRRDRQLDLMNPWNNQPRRDRQLDLMDPWGDR